MKKKKNVLFCTLHTSKIQALIQIEEFIYREINFQITCKETPNNKSSK